MLDPRSPHRQVGDPSGTGDRLASTRAPMIHSAAKPTPRCADRARRHVPDRSDRGHGRTHHQLVVPDRGADLGDGRTGGGRRPAGPRRLEVRRGAGVRDRHCSTCRCSARASCPGIRRRASGTRLHPTGVGSRSGRTTQGGSRWRWSRTYNCEVAPRRNIKRATWTHFLGPVSRGLTTSQPYGGARSFSTQPLPLGRLGAPKAGVDALQQPLAWHCLLAKTVSSPPWRCCLFPLDMERTIYLGAFDIIFFCLSFFDISSLDPCFV